jgi:hypothetical protein
MVGASVHRSRLPWKGDPKIAQYYTSQTRGVASCQSADVEVTNAVQTNACKWLEVTPWRMMEFVDASATRHISTVQEANGLCGKGEQS